MEPLPIQPSSPTSNASPISSDETTTTLEAGEFNLPPPPENTFPSYAAATQAMYTWAKDYGYDLSTYRSVKMKSGVIYKRIFRCTRAGKVDNKRKLTEEDRIRPKRGSKKTGCKMTIQLVTAEQSNPEGPWRIKHHQGQSSFIHNHEAASAIVLPGHRRRTRSEQVRGFIRSQYAATVDPSRILSTLQEEDLTLLITRQDVYNEQRQIKREKLGTMTPVEALFQSLQELNYFFDYLVTNEGTLDAIILIPPQAIQLLRDSPDILLFDCTYKTNRYNRPLLNLIGVSGSSQTIHLGLAMLPGEKEIHYTWAVDVLQKLFRQERIHVRLMITDREIALMNALEKTFVTTDMLICRWHQNKDVLTYVRKQLGQVWNEEMQENVNTEAAEAFMQCYYKCIGAETVADFEAAVVEAERCNKVCARYLAREWWPWKEKCVSAWTNQYTHFGLRETSRLEGSHAGLKKWLGSSRSEFSLFLDKHTKIWFKQA